ncbi:hypothetical protein COLO4_10958 [Corchorus olitorius]|uniref:Uncharacterized protein n=1 Tax=Corchorus olitorius TaxID=93759 RepID=A0A1R3K6B1_9ROSI|nr:hypothetical protein COLO4_10958 [Corchorus olitorius]
MKANRDYIMPGNVFISGPILGPLRFLGQPDHPGQSVGP